MVWSRIGELRDGHCREIVIDLRGLGYVDSEGLNYLVLIPFLLAQQGVRVRISLPQKENVLSFLNRFGIIDHYNAHYGVPDPPKRIPSHQVSGEEPLGQQTRLISRSGNTYVLTSSSIPAFFRQKALSFHLSYLGDSTANRCCAAILELAYNIFDHSGETAGCVTISYNRLRGGSKAGLAGRLFVAVSDLGIGVGSSLRLHAARKEAVTAQGLTDCECLQYALTPGISRTGIASRGHGLPTVARVAATTQLSSGKGLIMVNHDLSLIRTLETPQVPGTSAVLMFDVAQHAR